MSKHVIFLVHGMGDFAKGWSTDTQSHIKALYSAYDIASSFPFDNFFRFEEITYNSRFDSLRKQWRTDSAAVIEKLTEGGLQKSAAGDLAKLGAVPGKEEEFLSTHVLDVLLYKFVPMVAEEARTIVGKRILETLLDLPDLDRPRWSIIAHSLGTAVAHDSLHALYTQGFGGRTLSGVTKADVLMMVANVSRLLEEKKVDVYKSVVKPNALPAEGVCRHYINAKHDWDPIPRPKEFKPLDDWPDIRTRQEARFVHVAINAFQTRNVHSFTHYLSNPKVHVALFRRIFPIEGVISDQELAKAVSQHEAATPFGQFEALQQQLKKLQIADEAPWREIIKTFQDFFETIKAF
jgi:hypothetical protein